MEYQHLISKQEQEALLFSMYVSGSRTSVPIGIQALTIRGRRMPVLKTMFESLESEVIYHIREEVRRGL